MLSTDVKILILSYLPLKKLQLLNNVFGNQGLIILPKTVLTRLLRFKYNLTLPLNSKITTNLVIKPFELYCDYAMRLGATGYNGQFYLPPYVCLFNSVKDDDIELVQYYLLRYFVNSDWTSTTLALEWTNNASGHGAVLVNILLYLSKNDKIENLIIEYICKVLTNNGTVTAYYEAIDDIIKKRVIDFESDLIRLNSNKLNNYVQLSFPVVDLNELYWFIKQFGFIAFEVFDQAKVMYNKVDKLFAPSRNRDRYLNFLAILLGKNIDVSLASIEHEYFGLAISVMNYRVFDKFNRLGYKQYYYNHNITISMVIYDIKLINDNRGLDGRAKLYVSVYLSNRSLELSNTIPHIIMLYNDIVKFERRINTKHYCPKPEIYDPETALRLSTTVDVKPYLKPATEFDKNLMVQFGLL